MPEKKPAKGWTAVKKHVAEWDKPQLLALLKDLYDAGKANRTFLEARIQAESGGGAAIETYRARVVEPFYPKRGDGKLNLADGRKAIRDYQKATGNAEGTIELLLTYVENGTKFTCEYGDIDGRFYDSLCSATDEFVGLLIKTGPEAFKKVRERFEATVSKASHIGWGFGDHLVDALDKLYSEFEEEDEDDLEKIPFEEMPPP